MTENIGVHTDHSSNEVRRIRSAYAERERTHKSNEGNPGRRRLLRERNDALERILTERFRHPLSQCRVLDVGCGHGGLLGWFHERGVKPGDLYGVDLLPNRIRIARETFPAFTFLEGNAEQLSFPDDWFDLVLVFTVFSSILDVAMARSVAQNIGRVLTSRGVVVWYDMRYPNPWNPAIRAMTKSRIRELFPSFELQLEPSSLLPLVAHQLGRLTDRTYPLLASIPILRSHYIGLLRPSRGSRDCAAEHQPLRLCRAGRPPKHWPQHSRDCAAFTHAHRNGWSSLGCGALAVLALSRTAPAGKPGMMTGC